MQVKGIFTTMLAAGVVASLALPTFATNITTDGGNSSVPVELTAEAATFSVTVPTALPIEVDADGTVNVADDVAIVNNSPGAVKVTNMTITGAGNWAIVDWDSADMSTEKVGSTKIAMVINNDKTIADSGDGKLITFTEDNFPKMAGKNDGDTDELPITYDAKVPAQATELSDLTIANVVFTIGWDTGDTQQANVEKPDGCTCDYTDSQHSEDCGLYNAG